jgi:hypothetical protein
MRKEECIGYPDGYKYKFSMHLVVMSWRRAL